MFTIIILENLSNTVIKNDINIYIMIIFQGGEEQDFVSYFTIYHFIFGIIAGYLGIPLVYWFLIHFVIPV